MNMLGDCFFTSLIARTLKVVTRVLFAVMQAGESISPLQTLQQAMDGGVCADAVPDQVRNDNQLTRPTVMADADPPSQKNDCFR